MLKTEIRPELILKEEVRHLLDDFAALMKLRAAFFSGDGRMIQRGRDADNSGYCQLMQKEHFGLAECRKLDAFKQEECRKGKKIISYVCHAGLGEIIAPVMLFNKVEGFIVLGQFRVTPELPSFPLNCREREAYQALPLIQGEELRNLEHMLQMLLEYIVDKELVTYPQDLRMLRLNEYLERHLAEKVTLAAAAKSVSCSESTLTHYLQKHYRTSFSILLRGKRLERAEKILKEHPEWILSEVAEASGFESAYYFSRVFKAHRGQTPGQFKKSL